MKKLVILLTLVLSLTSCHRERQVQQILQKPRTECLVKTTPVKNQGASELCWIYAMLATIESDRLMEGDSVNLSPQFIARKYLEEQADRFYLSGGKEKISMRGMSSMLLHLLSRYGMTHYDAFHRDDVDFRVLTRKIEQMAQVSMAERKGLTVFRKDIGGMLDESLHGLPRYVFMLGAEYTTLEFAHSLCHEDDYEALTSFTHHPFGSRFVLETPDNHFHDSFLNVPLDTLMNRIEKTLKSGHAVCWEGDISEPRQKAFEQRQTTDDHCMEIIGMARTEKGNRYFICKNSWGTENPFGGWMYLSENYLREKTIAVWMKKN